MSYDFLTVGDTHLDTLMVLDPSEVKIVCDRDHEHCLICLSWEDKIPVRATYNFVAGNPANVAVTGARLGLVTGMYSLLGDDDIADIELRVLKAEGIDTTYATKTPGAMSHQSTVISIQGGRTILVYHAPRTYHLPDDLPATRWLYVTSLGHGFETLFPAVRSYVERTGARLAYQPGTHQLRSGSAAAAALLGVTEFIVMNKEEAQEYTGQLAADIPALLAGLHALGPKIVAITDGAEGSYASDGTRRWQMGIRPDIPRVESTGAGDAFSAAFVAALAHGEPIEQALRWGTLNAEGVIQEFGPQAGILRKAELENLLKRHSEFVAREF